MLGISIIIHGSRKTLLCTETLGEFIKIYASIREEEWHSSLLYKIYLIYNMLDQKVQHQEEFVYIRACMFALV